MVEKVKISENLQISRIVHGLWRLSDWNMSNKEILRLIEDCIELGVTTFDHADIYGDYRCEEIFGDALKLKSQLRNKMQIITKCGIKLISKNRPEHKIKYYDTSKEHIVKSVEKSLKNFNTDYIDVLLIHRPDPFMNPDEVAQAFTELKEQGKVLNFGVSNFNPSQFNMLSSKLDFPIVTNQIEISVGNFENFHNGVIEQCQEKSISPMAWSPLTGGKIFNSEEEKIIRIRQTLEKIKSQVGADSISEVMYAWLLNHPARIIPIVGSSKLDRIKSAINSIKIKLTREQWFEMWQSSTGKTVP